MAVGYIVADYRKENYKTDFEIWNKNYKIQSERENIEMSRPTLDSIRVGARTSDAKHQQLNIQHKHEK